MRRFSLIGLAALVALAGCSQTEGITLGPSGPSCTPTKAFQMWRADPDRVHILDVRTPAEYIFVGHAPMARNIPVKFLVHQWDPEAKEPVMRPNPNFIADVKKAYSPNETIAVMCKSGRRSAEAVKLMRAAGFANAVNIDGGFEGERDEDCGARGIGKLTKPGWKDSGLIWTYVLNPEVMYLPD